MCGRLSHVTGQSHQQSQHFILRLSRFFCLHHCFPWPTLFSLPRLEPAVRFFFFLFFVFGWGGHFSRRDTFSFLMRCTEYVMANREQPSCVDMQTCGQLALSQMPASVKLQMILFQHFSAHLQIVKADYTHAFHGLYCWDWKLKWLQGECGLLCCRVDLICLLSLSFW